MKFTVPKSPLEVFQRINDNSYLNDIRWRKSSNKNKSEINYNQEITNQINSLTITEEEVISLLGRKWKSNLSVIGAFINTYQYITSDKNVSAIPVASTSKFMISLCGSQRNASNLINLMCKIKLLTKATQNINVEKLVLDKNNKLVKSRVYNKEIEYSFTRGLCREYYYSKNIQNIIKNIIEKHNIVVKQNIKENIKQNIEEELISTRTKVETFENTDKIRFSSKLSIPCTEKDMDNIVKSSLYINYPQLEVYQKMADDMNKTLNEVNQISFQPTITYDKSKKYIKKIGIRATNTLVSAKKDKVENKDFHGKYKEDVLKEQLGDKYYEFDVKSSVPRVTKLLNTGIWEDNTVDIYEEIYNNMRNFISTRTKVETFDDMFYLPEEFSKETRTLFKSMFMKGYFDKSVSTIVNHVISSVLGQCTGLSDEDYEEYKDKCTEYTKAVMTAYVAAIKETLGNTYDSEIFLHESCIYLQVAKIIRERGIKLVQIYDGFYTDKKVEDIEEIVKEVAEKYYREYITREEISHISSISTLSTRTKVERFESDDIEPIFLLKYYTIENVPYEIWSKVEPDWNKFCRNYAVLLNRYKKE